MRLWIKSTAIAGIVLAAALAPNQVVAQTGETSKPTAPASDGKKEPPAPAETKVTLNLQNAPLREALEKLFAQTKSDFSLDGSVQGYVSLKVTDQPLESALRLLLNRSSVPLTYTKESGVYFIKPRRTRQASEVSEPPLPGEARSGGGATQRTLIADQDGNRLITAEGVLGGGRHLDVIHLMYLDPADIASLFNIIQIPTFSRQMGAGSGGSTSSGQAILPKN
ncbi:MAG: hypothetical protein V4671_05815 [Armatimonadota bacterium]